jgi:hypothetical protein
MLGFVERRFAITLPAVPATYLVSLISWNKAKDVRTANDDIVVREILPELRRIREEPS